MPDFRTANAEFYRQAAILEALLATVDICGRQDSQAPTLVEGKLLPIIPTGGQNTMVAAAVVLLASHFEEYVRQQIEEYAAAIVIEYVHLEDDIRENLIDNYWRAGSRKLSQIRPKGNVGWATEAESMLRSLISYPIQGNLVDFVGGMLSGHENNMRWETILDLTKRIGVTKLSDQLFRHAGIRSNLGNPRKAEFSKILQNSLNEFYHMRNGIVHSIAQNSGIGATVFHNWAQFFRQLTTALADAFDASFQDLSIKLSRRKATQSPAPTP